MRPTPLRKPSRAVSWYQLLDIAVEGLSYVEEERTSPPLACPFDGEPLREAPNSASGARYCPLGNYEWPRQPRII